MTVYIVNAFPAGVVPPQGALVRWFPVEPAVVAEYADEGAVSAIGHEDTARLVSFLIGRNVPAQRITIPQLNVGDVLLVAAYRGPRLPEGATTLPEGAEVVFFEVTFRSLLAEVDEPTRAMIPPGDPRTQDEFWQAAICRRAQELGERADWSKARPLADVADGHRRALDPAELIRLGLTPDDPVVLHSSGYNGKRPVYLVRSRAGQYVFAIGTYFGSNSGFWFEAPDLDRIFSEAELTRLRFLAHGLAK